MQADRRRTETGQGYLGGAVILTAGTLAVKAVGMFFKIPLQALLGGSGYAYFGTAYHMFGPLSALATAGLPVAVAALVSRYRAEGRWQDVRQLLRLSRRMFWAAGLCGTLGMLLGAGAFARAACSPGAKLAIWCMAPAVLTCCVLSSYRGYYQGLGNMLPTSLSQVAEAVAKVVLGLSLTGWARAELVGEYRRFGTVLGRGLSAGQAASAISQLTAAAAVTGVTLSTVAGCVFLGLRHRLWGDGISPEAVRAAPPPQPAGQMIRAVLRLGLPVCLASLAASAGGLIDSLTIQNRLAQVMEQAPQVLLAQYGALLGPGHAEAGTVHTELYGYYLGIAENLSNMVVSLTAGFAVSALPMVAAAWARGDRRRREESVGTVLRVTALVSVPAGMGLCALAQPVASLFYAGDPQGVAIAAPLLSVLGIGGIFLALVGSLNSVLQAAGQPGAPVVVLLAGSGIKLAVNYFGIAQPQWNIRAAPAATLCGYGLAFFLGLWLLRRRTGVRCRAGELLAKPVLAGVLCAGTARLLWALLHPVWPSALAVLPCAAAGAAVYAGAILLLRGIRRQEALLLPGGEKLAEILAKRALLG